MAPKKKGGNKKQDNWEDDLGETIDPIAQATQAAKDAEAEQEKPAAEDDAAGGGGGGLLAALRKNKNKRAKKGKADNDFLDGEDPVAGDAPATNGVDLSAKAPEEANIEEDVFAEPVKKSKGGKKEPEASEKNDEDDEDDGAGGVKSKKEKEREKKEREKQRKKENVRYGIDRFL